MKSDPVPPPDDFPGESKHHLRFHFHTKHLATAFGSDSFGKRAEAFARFFGTPVFLIGQTIIVITWIILNLIGVVKFDLYPFILLNLAFSLQAAYAAPLILLAQTRQADRERGLAESDALHREELARINLERQDESGKQIHLLLELLERNNELTDLTHQLSQRISEITAEMNEHLKKS